MNQLKPKPEIIVAGDVCVDWLSIPVAPAPVSPEGQSQPNWQLRRGRYMYARRGGAWLTADFLKAAVGEVAVVHGPGTPKDQQSIPKDLGSIPPNDLIHSLISLDVFERKRGDKDVKVWGVREFDGFAGPKGGRPEAPPALESNPPGAAMVVLDDAGNGFRDSESEKSWPTALKGDEPIILHKVRRPLLKGALWDRLGVHLGRTIVVLDVDDLRDEGAAISRHLSWERTAADLVVALCHDDTYGPLTRCWHLIVRLGLEGAVHLSRDGGVPHARLWYVPDLIEGDLLNEARRGGMAGFASAFAAAVAVAVAKEIAEVTRVGSEPPSVEAVRRGIVDGMLAARHLLDLAYGEVQITEGGKTRRDAPAYPTSKLFSGPIPGDKPCETDLPPIPDPADSRAVNAFRNWRILDVSRKESNRTKREKSIRELAEEVVHRGLKKALPEIPVARFGDLETIDRWEIESYRSIRNLIREFLKDPSPKRPLCLAVFGRPGSGKSFGVTEVANSVAEKHPIEKLDFNLSQWNSAGELAVALHRVRDSGPRGKVPLVFFDEFDSQFDGSELGWLKYFLGPMNEGVFSDGHFTHLLGPAILVFAGGTSSTFLEFQQKTLVAGKASPDLKAPDFLSRLRGVVDVAGPDPLADTRMLGRAMILRRALKKRARTLFDEEETPRIDPGVLAAFLNVFEYRHGARSIEALVEMSQLQGRERFEPSLLPPPLQMRLHVDPEEFTLILRRWTHFEEKLEAIAEAIHESFVDGLLAGAEESEEEIRARPGRQRWKELGLIFKESSRDQAAHIFAKLASVGCDLLRSPEGKASKPFQFDDKEVPSLAEMEHMRFSAERSQKQPDHPELKSWAELPQEARDKDIRHIRTLPEILRKNGWKIVRLKPTDPEPSEARVAAPVGPGASPGGAPGSG